MPTWEETKRAGQTASTLAGNLFQDIQSSVADSYQQILISGHLFPSHGKDSLTQQIAEGMFPEPEHEEEIFYRNHFHDLDHPKDDTELEPER